MVSRANPITTSSCYSRAQSILFKLVFVPELSTKAQALLCETKFTAQTSATL